MTSCICDSIGMIVVQAVFYSEYHGHQRPEHTHTDMQNASLRTCENLEGRIFQDPRRVVLNLLSGLVDSSYPSRKIVSYPLVPRDAWHMHHLSGTRSSQLDRCQSSQVTGCAARQNAV